jgi:hypothetical protein
MGNKTNRVNRYMKIRSFITKQKRLYFSCIKTNRVNPLHEEKKVDRKQITDFDLR